MAITINTQSRDFTEVEQYLMTIDRGIKSLKDVEDNTSIPVAGYLTFTDEKRMEITLIFYQSLHRTMRYSLVSHLLSSVVLIILLTSCMVNSLVLIKLAVHQRTVGLILTAHLM